MLNSYFRSPGRLALRVLAIIGATLIFSSIFLAQSTPGTGAIRGIVIDPSGEPIPDAKVTITSKIRVSVVHVTTSSEGVYSSGPLEPGEYSVRVAAKGFKTQELGLLVRVAVTAGGSARLEAGPETEVQAFPALAAVVNLEQPTVQSMLLASQLETLPLNGRNYFDLAQLVPAVQFQDAAIFDPGKTGFSSISFEGHYSRDARVEVDGVSISDETVGAIAQNIPASAVLEANVSQASLDLPTELTSSGTLNIATRSGGDALHGEAFGTYLGHQGSAALPGSQGLPYQREQFGARAGGALIKDKVFWFLDAERLQQNVTFAEPFVAPFNTVGVSQPLRETQADGRLDWQRREDAHAFYRFGFDQLSQTRSFGSASSLQEFNSSSHVPSNTLGYDFTQGRYTHSIRFEYLRSGNGVTDYTGNIPAGVDNPIPGVGINIGAPVNGNCALSGGGAYCSGPSPFAPQSTLQSVLEFRYDGTRLMGSHVWRYGLTYNRIHAGMLAAAFTAPQVGTTNLCLPGATVPLCVADPDPTAYPVDFAFLGNGIGFSTAQSAFGYPGGGLGPDNQFEAYAGDSWKTSRNLTLTYGVRYVHDTGRVDSNLGSLQALDDWLPGLSNPVRNPNSNFAPQFGFAWDAGGTGHTVIHAGAGLYYASSLWNDTLLDSRGRSPNGLLADTPQVCNFSVPTPFTWPTSLGGSAQGSTIAGGAGVVSNPAANQVEPTFCGSAISSAASPILALSSAFQAAAAAAGSQSNLNYVGNSLSAINANGVDVFSPNYRTPRSYQMNLGIQQELRPGTVISIDYIRQIGEHNLMILDANHSGAARSYNYANAVAARDSAQLAAGCPTGMDQAQCMVSVYGGIPGAQAAYSAAGLDSNSATTGGAPCSFCAFPGITPNPGLNHSGAGGGSGALGTLDLLSTVGRSVYSGYQLKIVHRVLHPMQGVREANFQLSYAYSKYVSQSQDQDFPAVATDNDNPLLFTGPNGLDRKHQVSFFGTFDLPFGIKGSMIGHFYSPLPQNLLLPELTNGGEIFATDWLGAGLGSGGSPEPVRGTQIGQFNRGTNINTLPRVINTYNTNFAGTLTPAGHCLVADEFCPGGAPIEVMTPLDMATLNWVMPNLPSTPFDAAGFPWLKTFDLKASWPIRVGDRFTVEPSVGVFNIFNFANAFLPGNMALSSLAPGPNANAISNGVLGPNTVGGITGGNLTPFRAGFQSGTFALGAPRQLAFGLRISF